MYNITQRKLIGIFKYNYEEYIIVISVGSTKVEKIVFTQAFFFVLQGLFLK